MIKQVIIVRKDLKMRKGKMIAQGAHASLQAAFNSMESKPDWFHSWFTDGSSLMRKIAVSADSLEELNTLYKAAQEAGLPCSLIEDAGLTEFKKPTFTAVAIGPAPADLVDLITKDLILL